MLELSQIFFGKEIIKYGCSYLIKAALLWLPTLSKLMIDLFYISISLLLILWLYQHFNLPLEKKFAWLLNKIETKASSNQRLALLVQQTPLAVIEWTADFKVAAWNPAAEKIFGYCKDEALGCLGIKLIVPPQDREQVNQVWEQLLQQKGGTRSTNQNFTKEGKTIYCEWYNTPLINSKGKVIGVASLVQDISERKLAQQAESQTKNELEVRVEARTAQLKQALTELKEVIADLKREIVQRREIEAALEEREQQYRSVVDNVKEVICQTDIYGNWTFLNPAWSEITNFGLADTIGTSCLDYIHPDDRQLNIEQFQSLLKGKKEYCRYEIRYLTAQGKYLWIEVFTQLSFDAEGTINGTCGTLYDITARHLSEAALRQSEERFRSLVANIPGIVYRRQHNPDWTINFISQEIEKISGYPIADLLHNQVRSFASLIEPQDRLRVETIISNSLAQKQPYVIEYRTICADKSVKWFYEKGQGVFDQSGNLLWLDGVIFDSTEYKHTQEELRSSEDNFRQLTENIREVFFLTTPELDQMLYISPAYEEVWGRTTQSLYQEPLSWLDSVHPEDRDHLISTSTRNLKKKQNFEIDYRIVRPDASVRWVGVRSFLIRNESGIVTRIAGLAEDVTERKQAETEILNALAKEKELGDLKSRFISVTSHEFRTPLTTIMSTAELLEHYEWTKQEEVEQLQMIQDAVRQMLQLLEDILLIGTADAGQLRFNPEPLELNEFCQHLVSQVELGANSKPTSDDETNLYQASIKLICLERTFLACMDKKLLRQLLFNLLSNAIKYSPSGGTIELKLATQGDKAIFQIQDQGLGIPKEDQPRLFEFFHRAKNVGAIAGTGLGLAIVKQCVDIHGGSITVESEVGVGTRFTVILPLKNHFLIAPYGTKPNTQTMKALQPHTI
jgi:PAS domain S-box-containing protein